MIVARNARPGAAFTLNSPGTAPMTRLDDGAMRLRDGCPVWQAGRCAAERSRWPLLSKPTSLLLARGARALSLQNGLRAMVTGSSLIDRACAGNGIYGGEHGDAAVGAGCSLLEIEDRLGMEAAADLIRMQAARVYHRRAGSPQCASTVISPSALLYLAGNELDAADLREETQLRAILD